MLEKSFSSWPEDHDIGSEIKAAARAKFDEKKGAGGDAYKDLVKPMLDEANKVLFKRLALDSSIGDLLTEAGCQKANTIVSKALSTLAEVFGQLNSQKSMLQRIYADNIVVEKTQREAGDIYLNTNYEDAGADFKTILLAMFGSISIARQSYSIPEAALQLISDALEAEDNYFSGLIWLI
jgi:hypothetical protein